MLRDVLLLTPFACGDPFVFRDGGYADVHGVVIPFQISCGQCFMCDRGLQTQCETTQVREQGSGAALFGYSQLYGSVPGGQAQYLRVPHADSTHIKVPQGPADDRFVYLSDVLPTAWQAVEYAEIPDGGTVTVLGLGPIGDMAGRIAGHRGARVIAVDLVPERLARASARGMEVIDLGDAGSDDPAASHGRRSPGGGYVRDAPAAVVGCAACVRHLPTKAGRRGEDRLHSLMFGRRSREDSRKHGIERRPGRRRPVSVALHPRPHRERQVSAECAAEADQ
ncbi:alcohol dehydrogenase-like protein [Rhodococcus sp. SMB37]|nr:alcohol dehydrogenase-like protein [Rhodococcus sp. SMB37]